MPRPTPPPGGSTGTPVHVRGLVKRYGELAAVDGLDLDIRAGEVFALLGPNGAGKTTTTEILEGFRRRDGGEVRVLGEDPHRAGRAWRNRIGVVLQSTDDYAELTVVEMVGHFARFFARPRDVDELIEAVGLNPKRKTRVRQLSGGQRRRLDVALGIVGSPELLFLDEPTTGFDPQARHVFWDLIHGLRADGVTILLTTHYLDEAERLADRVGVIFGGRMVDVDTPARLGGRQDQAATVVWRDGSERTTTPTRLVARLAEQYAGEVPGLQVLRPSLEDVYLAMIGQSR